MFLGCLPVQVIGLGCYEQCEFEGGAAEIETGCGTGVRAARKEEAEGERAVQG